MLHFIDNVIAEEAHRLFGEADCHVSRDTPLRKLGLLGNNDLGWLLDTVCKRLACPTLVTKGVEGTVGGLADMLATVCDLRAAA